MKIPFLAVTEKACQVFSKTKLMLIVALNYAELCTMTKFKRSHYWPIFLFTSVETCP
jgi:hypothetical protein